MKNARPFCGQPLITYSIRAALESGLFSRVVVSTDSAEIAAIARRSGAEVPFVRPTAISDEVTPLAPVVKHALQQLGGHEAFEFCCCIYATAPFLTPERIVEGYELLRASDAAAALGVTTFEFPIERAMRLGSDGRVAFVSPEHALTRSQDLPERVHDAGQFVWIRSRHFTANRTLIPANTVGVKIPRHLAQDIDTEEDWAYAEAMFAAIASKRCDAGNASHA